MTSNLDRVCVVIARTRHRMMMVEIQEAAKRGAKMLELRLDFLNRAPEMKRLLENRPCPLVATIRRPEDGGRWKGTEEQRRMLLRQCIASGFDWVDLETSVADEIRRYGSVKRIVSYHNPDNVPENLDQIYEKMLQQDADVLKLSVAAQQPEDNIRILSLIKNAKKPTIAHCMGDIGLPSRLLGLKYGAPFVYAAFNPERVIAPGMPSMNDVQTVYPVGGIKADTKVFGVIGDPVAHSLSPLVHNRLFRAYGINAIYLPFRVPRGGLESFLTAFDSIPVHGFSVTIPHKEAAAAIAKKPDDTVKQTRAANTLVRLTGEAGFAAANTDYQAVIDSLLAAMGPGEDGRPPKLAGKMVVLLGAGGVGRAIAHALKQAGSILTISNRTPERAHALAAEVEGRVLEWMGRHVTGCDILVNATSVGMYPNLDDTPIHAGYLQPGMTVFDTVYNPESTVLIKAARQRNCRVVTGLEMFVRQAALQFEMFTGKQPPLDELRDIVRRALSPITQLSDEEEAEAKE
ncbi:MAG TPA: shikimate dehydrogenase [Gemmataceae bacterium]|jgi:3-dehydroquinate dehydratase/shikimate dehydrogenase|nr:shikimate dehydrogenase [Gemmataceae bacterium]